MATTKNLATVPSTELSNAINLLAEANGEIVRLPYSLIDEKLVPLEEHMDNENNPHKLDADDIGAATAQEVQELKTEFSEYKISNDAELAQQKSDFNEYKGKTDVLESRPVNNNILINSNFANPVNQRGYAQSIVATTVANQYWIDRWKVGYYAGHANTTLSMNRDHISIKETESTYDNSIWITQFIEFPEKYAGKKVTLSAKYECSATDGNLQIGWFIGSTKASADVLLDKNKTEVSVTFELPLDIDTFLVQIADKYAPDKNSNELKLYWVKLEIGDHATPYVPRLYAEELALCQRYYYKQSVFPSTVIGIFQNDMYFNTSIPKMRIDKPSWTLSECVLKKNLFEDQASFSFTVTYISTDEKVVNVQAAKDNHGLSFGDCLRIGGYITLDAEL